ncbi:MAG: hypothetical protein DME39_03875, partial [Verrucomicrobia bacterium]
KEVDPGLIATIKNDVVPWLQQLAAKTAEQEQRLAEDPRAHWFTLVFDREGNADSRIMPTPIPGRTLIQ